MPPTLAAQIPCLLYEYKINHVTGAATFPFCSHEFCEELFGVTGKAVMEDPAAMVNLLHPEDTERFAAAVGVSMQTMAPFHCRMRMYHVRRKEYIHVLDRSLPYRSQDVNSEGQAEPVTIWKGFIIEDDMPGGLDTSSSLSSSSCHEVSKDAEDDTWMLEWVDSPLVPCFSLCSEGLVRIWSSSMEELTGLKSVDVRGRAFHSLLVGKESVVPSSFLGTLQEEKVCEYTIRGQSGNDVHLKLSAKRRSSTLCVMCQDVTHIRDLERQCNEATKLVESERSLTEWLSHEIRNPLSVVMEATQALEQNSSQSTALSSYLPMIRQCVTFVGESVRLPSGEIVYYKSTS